MPASVFSGLLPEPPSTPAKRIIVPLAMIRRMTCCWESLSSSWLPELSTARPYVACCISAAEASPPSPP